MEDRTFSTSQVSKTMKSTRQFAQASQFMPQMLRQGIYICEKLSALIIFPPFPLFQCFESDVNRRVEIGDDNPVSQYTF
jgi:hypothetical protein